MANDAAAERVHFPLFPLREFVRGDRGGGREQTENKRLDAPTNGVRALSIAYGNGKLIKQSELLESSPGQSGNYQRQTVVAMPVDPLRVSHY